jgi:hypothetical protein
MLVVIWIVAVLLDLVVIVISSWWNYLHSEMIVPMIATYMLFNIIMLIIQLGGASDLFDDIWAEVGHMFSVHW